MHRILYAIHSRKLLYDVDDGVACNSDIYLMLYNKLTHEGITNKLANWRLELAIDTVT